MTKLTFKQFKQFVEDELNEEELHEIFGVFRNNAKIDALKKKKEELAAQKRALQRQKDEIFKKAKERVERENGGFNPLERGSMTMRSQQAQGRAAERDWVRGLGESADESYWLVLFDVDGATVAAVERVGSEKPTTAQVKKINLRILQKESGWKAEVKDLVGDEFPDEQAVADHKLSYNGYTVVLADSSASARRKGMSKFMSESALREGKAGKFGVKLGGISFEDASFGFEDRLNAQKTASELKDAGIEFTRTQAGGIFYFHFDSMAEMRKAARLAKRVINKDEESEW